MKNSIQRISTILKSTIMILALSILQSCDSSSDEKNNFDPTKKNLLECKKDWSSRTEMEKAIGCWTSKPEELNGSGRPGRVHGSENYQLIFYSDGTMDDLSYFTIVFSKNEPLTYRYVNCKIENGILYRDYYHEGKVEPATPFPISISETTIEYNDRKYYKSDCF